MYKAVLDFWFRETDAKMRWCKDADFDRSIEQRFSKLHKQASLGELYMWRNTAEGALAEIIVLDQFSRNIFRDTPRAFECDPLALALAQTAIEKELDGKLPQTERSFMYMPFMHSESALIHKQALSLFTALGAEGSLEFEIRHKNIIDQFGRYPHRNAILGRQSTAEELAFLAQPGSSF